MASDVIILPFSLSCTISARPRALWCDHFHRVYCLTCIRCCKLKPWCFVMVCPTQPKSNLRVLWYFKSQTVGWTNSKYPCDVSRKIAIAWLSNTAWRMITGRVYTHTLCKALYIVRIIQHKYYTQRRSHGELEGGWTPISLQIYSWNL